VAVEKKAEKESGAHGVPLFRAPHHEDGIETRIPEQSAGLKDAGDAEIERLLIGKFCRYHSGTNIKRVLRIDGFDKWGGSDLKDAHLVCADLTVAAEKSRALSCKGEDDIDGRRRHLGQTAELLHRRNERVDFDRTATLEILKHRRFVGTDGTRALNALIHSDRKVDSQLLTDRLSFDHHCADCGASAGVGSDLFKGSAGQG